MRRNDSLCCLKTRKQIHVFGKFPASRIFSLLIQGKSDINKWKKLGPGSIS